MPRRRASISVGAMAVVSALTLAACAVGPSDRPAVAHDGASAGGPGQPTTSAPQKPIPPLTDPQDSALSWTDCTDTVNRKLGGVNGLRVGCAKLSTTLDSPTRPGRGSNRVQLTKIGDGKQPLVVLNDALGEPGSLYAVRLAAQLPKEILDVYHLIGVDRRGTGDSDGVRCVNQPSRTAMVGFDPSITDAATLGQLLDTTRDAAQECMLDLDEQLGAYDTWRTANDMNSLREALGVPRLNAVARGDASRVLTAFAERFSNEVGRFVLDGSPDPSVDAVGQAEARASGLKDTFAAFTADCATRGCALGASPDQVVTALLDKLRTQPVRGPRLTFQAGTALRAIAAGLADRPRWPELADAIVKARDGDVSGLESFVIPLWNGPDRDMIRLDGGLVTTCNDTTTRVDPARAATLAQEWSAKYPIFGAMSAHELAWCMPWPVPAQPLPVPRAPEAPPMLVLGTEKDAITPLPGTTKTAEALASAVQVNWQGAGHGAFAKSACVNEASRLFLVEGKAPTNGTVCPP
ncbi:MULTISPECIES: alpha/beta hydrolase [unclassified Crossiella]|uniref:alpha/beta hydrolase n=1 Tax=unclassified Crossiella TaxID=2620835 RepID=UPI001FFF4DDC|nr:MULTISPECIES: alpha/beta hydrolase [unclassified Crossiella]MCK2240486.1 alpha/beta hydrolase [Crossiella sp. S99.2]MCK2253063.1 alpha/beta hydrolase [Crossiella sp. S99.1]